MIRQWIGAKLHGLARRILGRREEIVALPEGVTIAASATFRRDRLRWHENCSLSIGGDSHIGGSVLFERSGATIEIGDRVFCSGSLVCATRLSIGDDVMIAWGTTVIDHNSHSVFFEERKDDVVDWKRGHKDWANVPVSPVIIEEKAWIGFNVIILKGVRIGAGAVVGAGSVVTKNVEPLTVVGGNPAKLIRKLEAEDTVGNCE